MGPGSFQFDRFALDPTDRQLLRDGAPVELNARYLDALALLVSEHGKLITKDRFLDEVWRGVPVTDEALTQCIKTLRRQLGDDASRPTFIETVPKHGYRFIAPVEAGAAQTAPAAPAGSEGFDWHRLLVLGGAGTGGGAIAGLAGGLFYGLSGASQPIGPGMGAVSVLLVLLFLTIGLAVIGAAGVAFGIAGARLAAGRSLAWSLAGGAIGGAIVGAFVKLLATDAVKLLFANPPGDVTGGGEGALLGAAVGIAAWVAARIALKHSIRRAVASAAAIGACAGLAIVAFGGRLMGGSLGQLADQFPGSSLSLGQIGALLGEQGFGPRSQLVTAGLEGALFSACVVAAILYASERLAGAQRA